MSHTGGSRIGWVDTMKAFSIMAVVLFHTQLMPEIRTAAYLVCLPAFFFAAGLFTNTTLSPREFFLKKTLRLLIPYVLWGVLTWAFWFFVSSRYGSTTDDDIAWWQPLVGMLYGRADKLSHNGPLWFLCCMMSLEWIYYGISRISRQWVRWIVILAVGGVGCVLAYLEQNWIWGISAACIILPLYALGAEYKVFFKEKTGDLSMPKLCLVLAGSLAGLWVGYTYNGDIKLCDSIIGNPWLYYLTVLSAVGLWLSIALILEKAGGRIVRFIQYIGRNTLLVLCLHFPTFSVIKGMAVLCRIPLSFFETTTGCFVLCISTFAILLPLAYVFNRYMPIFSPFPLRTRTDDTSVKLSEKRQ